MDTLANMDANSQAKKNKCKKGALINTIVQKNMQFSKLNEDLNIGEKSSCI